MKALSLSQPMAWAIFNGKDVENRNWRTAYRGRFIVHAAKSFNIEHWNWIAGNENRLGPVSYTHLTLPTSDLV